MRRLGVVLSLVLVAAIASVWASSYLSQQSLQRTSQIFVKGHLQLVLYDQFGGVKDVLEVDNLITNAGFDAICKQISGTPGANFTWITIGSGTTSAAVTDTALGSEIARGSGTYSHTTGTKTFTVTYMFGAGVGTGAVTEAGVFNASTGGTLLCRQTFAVINKGASDTLQITWTFTLS